MKIACPDNVENGIILMYGGILEFKSLIISILNFFNGLFYTCINSDILWNNFFFYFVSLIQLNLDACFSFKENIQCWNIYT